MTGPLNSAKPTTSVVIAGVYNGTSPAPTDGQAVALQVDSAGNLKTTGGGGGGGVVQIEDSTGQALNSNGSGALQVAVVSGGGSNPSVGTTGVTAPTSATEIGVIDNSGKLQGASDANPVRVDPTGTTVQPVSASALPLPTGAATSANQVPPGTAGSPNAAVQSVQGVSGGTPVPVSGTVAVTLPAGQAVELLDSGGTNKASISAAGALKVDGSAVTQPVSGTVTANAGTNLNTSLLALESGGNLATLAGTVSSSRVSTTDAADGTIGSNVPATALYVGTDNSSGKLTGLVSDANGFLKTTNLSIPAVIPGFVQGIAVNLPGASTTFNETFTNPNASGNLLVYTQRSGVGTVSTITDSQNNTWVKLTNSFWYALNAIGGSNTVTITYTGSVNGQFCLGEYAGVSGAPYASSVGTAGTGTSITSGNLITTGPYALLIANLYNSTSNTVTYTGTNGWTANIGNISGNDVQLSFALPASGTTDATVTANTSITWNIDVYVFPTAVPVLVNQGGPTTLGNAWACEQVAATTAAASGNVALRTPAIFKTAQATASGNTAVWTPTSGKKFRLMRFNISIPAQCKQSSGGILTITFQDSSTGINHAYDVFVPGTVDTISGEDFQSGWIDLGNGFLSAAANNVLNVNLSAALTAGNVRVNTAGTEE